MCRVVSRMGYNGEGLHKRNVYINVISPRLISQISGAFGFESSRLSLIRIIDFVSAIPRAIRD